MNGKSIGFKIKQSAFLWMVCLCGISIYSCSEDSIAKREIPEIGLAKVQLIKDVNGKDSLLILGISYSDKDGDIGLNPNDTFPPFNPGSDFQYNLLLSIYEVKDGNLTPVNQQGTSTPENFNQRVPNLTPTGKNKHISGVIDIRLDATKNYLYPDTIKCVIQLIDRGLNKSNLVESKKLKLTH